MNSIVLNGVGSNKEMVPRWLNFSMFLLFSLFVVMRLFFKEVFGFVEPVFYLLCLYLFYKYSDGKVRRFGWILLPAILIPIGSWVFMKLDHPEFASSTPKVGDFLDKFIFIYLGFFLFLNKERIPFFAFLAATVILLAPWLSGYGFKEIQDAITNGVRVEFGMVTIRVALLFGLVAIGCVVFLTSARRGWAVFCFVTAVLFYSVYIIFLTQTRAVLVGFVAFFIVYFMVKYRKGFRWSSILKTGSILSFCVLMIYSFGFLDPMFSRFKAEENIVKGYVVEGQSAAELPESSISLRLKFWDASLKYGMERPLVGWGYGGGRIILEESGIVDKNDTFFKTVHNAYLELFVRYGLIGLIFMLGVIFVFLLFFIKALAKGIVPEWVVLFAPSGLIYFFSISLFTSDLFYWQSLYVFNLMMALVAAYGFEYLKHNNEDAVDVR